MIGKVELVSTVVELSQFTTVVSRRICVRDCGLIWIIKDWCSSNCIIQSSLLVVDVVNLKGWLTENGFFEVTEWVRNCSISWYWSLGYKDSIWRMTVFLEWFLILIKGVRRTINIKACLYVVGQDRHPSDLKALLRWTAPVLQLLRNLCLCEPNWWKVWLQSQYSRKRSVIWRSKLLRLKMFCDWWSCLLPLSYYSIMWYDFISFLKKEIDSARGVKLRKCPKLDFKGLDDSHYTNMVLSVYLIRKRNPPKYINKKK